MLYLCVCVVCVCALCVCVCCVCVCGRCGWGGKTGAGVSDSVPAHRDIALDYTKYVYTTHETHMTALQRRSRTRRQHRTVNRERAVHVGHLRLSLQLGLRVCHNVALFDEDVDANLRPDAYPPAGSASRQQRQSSAAPVVSSASRQQQQQQQQQRRQRRRRRRRQCSNNTRTFAPPRPAQWSGSCAESR